MTDSTKLVTPVAKRKPPAAGMGRKKGSVNKIPAALKDMILTALDKSGGVDYLVTQADENPNAFLTLVGKVLPLQVDAAHSGEIVARVVFKGLND